MQNEGEKEIVLGNKQLISLFFVVVALLGVFFAAGYMIGRKSVTPSSTAPSSDAASTTSGSASSSKQDAENPRETSRETASSESPAPADPGPGTMSQVPETRPEQKPVPTRQLTHETNPEPGSETPVHKAEPPAHVARVEKAAETSVSRPEVGATYLQVTALRRPDADNLVRSLREQNFPAMLAESSKEGLYRVLVGPYHETAKVAESKSRLKALGFANAFVQK